MKKNIKIDFRPLSVEKQRQIHEIAKTAVSDAWVKVKSTTVTTPFPHVVIDKDKK